MIRLRRLAILLLMLVALISPAVPLVAMAQTPGEEIPTFDAFLEALSGPLIAGAVAVILSWAIEYWPAYEKFEPKWKRLVFFGLCLILPLLVALLRAALGYVEMTWDPLLWHALWYGAAAGGIGTLAHTRKL